ncbi:MAG TPA: NADH:flavin oxidoreductase [Planctomycetota bacterium]|nr:NADH:flavin oxidoreductase [Planctomycetota bacterium]
MTITPGAIRHPLPPLRVPTRDEAARSRWFSPVRLGPTTARTRTWVPAMVPWRATDDGFVTPHVIDWYARFARGRPGTLVVEATGVRDVPSGPLLRIGHDRYVPGLRTLVEAVRSASGGATRLFIQCIDFLAVRRRPEPAKYFARFLEITPRHREALAALRSDATFLAADEPRVRAALAGATEADLAALLTPRELESLLFGYREKVNDLHLPHVRDLPRTLPGLFADAAVRARDAGFDGVELHYAHAYTMASFLSRTNVRDDGYGGSPEARVRLPLEVFAAVRAKVGAGFAVGCRFLGDEAVDGGSRIEDACFYAERFARAGMDFLSVSKGGKFDDAKRPKVGDAVYPYTGLSGYECMPTVKSDARGPFGRNAPLAAAVRRTVRAAGFETPVVAAGGVATFDQAEEMLARGDADVVASARQTLADPDWFLKLELGRGDEIRRCEFTNYCEALDQRHVEVTCKLWDRDFDPAAPPTLSADGKRRLVAPAWAV